MSARRAALGLAALLCAATALGALLLQLWIARHWPQVASPREGIGTCRAPLLLAHRGYHAEAPENSVEAVRAAAALAFPGVELDVWWWRGDVVLGHDAPRADQSRPPLEAIYASGAARDLYVWLDFKNLSARNAQAVAARLRDLIERYALHERLLVEARAPEALAHLRNRLPSLASALWIDYAETQPARAFYDFLLRARLLAFRPHALSLPHPYLDARFARDYQHLPLGVWTIDERDLLSRALERGADLVLSNREWRTDFPHLHRPLAALCGPGS